MSDARAATFRTIASAKATPEWIVAPHEVVATAAFPRHGMPIAAPIEDVIEAPAPVSDVVPMDADVRVPSIPAPPPVPEIPTPDPGILDALAALATAREQVIARAQDEVLRLAVDVARAVIDAEIEARPELHTQLVKAALEVLGPGSPRVRVGAAAYEAMTRTIGGRSFELDGRRLEIELDASIHGSGVVLETNDARVDATIDTRLAGVRAEIARAIERRAA